MSTLSDFLKQKRLNMGLTLEEVGKKVGVGKSTVRKWENGLIENMGRDKIVLLSKALDISPLDILEIDTSLEDSKSSHLLLDMFNVLSSERQDEVLSFTKQQLNKQNSNNTNEINEDIFEFPQRTIISGRSTAAGAPIDGEYEDSNANVSVVDRAEIPRNADEILTIAGDSMEPRLHKGQQAFIHHQPTVENGEIAIISIEDIGVTCKFVYIGEDKIRLVSANDKYDDIIYPIEEIRIIGKVL
ncbi:phage repressor like XRE family transcriptional regulator [Dellaglioa algida DSM 15638]|uniref:Phage repressor like XRE family transcriptional regulator n=1 Tax=Dellaglioa algida DSM 15638 TaxID=1423719 RepID=A0A0R1HPR1_9LACO|nr:S24 family peptidase [Dellaglioa algida]KRK45114.1 phage repressor like XRE family transcriptional regulator [Dellaglioa algida DSM 15638]MDK1735001.1 helix-turn-helix domain-containing protein [Dellaglioa algida]